MFSIEKITREYKSFSCAAKREAQRLGKMFITVAGICHWRGCKEGRDDRESRRRGEWGSGRRGDRVTHRLQSPPLAHSPTRPVSHSLFTSLFPFVTIVGYNPGRGPLWKTPWKEMTLLRCSPVSR